jgi:hypothetical protein
MQCLTKFLEQTVNMYTTKSTPSDILGNIFSYDIYIRKPQMELELHGGRLKKTKMAFKCFKKFKTKNLDVDNVGIYKAVKSQVKIRCTLG